MGPVDIIIIAAAAAAVTAAAVFIVRRRKKGKCSCGCEGCIGCGAKAADSNKKG